MFKRRLSKRGKSKVTRTLDAANPAPRYYNSSGSDCTSSANSQGLISSNGGNIDSGLSAQRSVESICETPEVVPTVSTETNKSKRGRRIQFVHVQVREFERIIGDNPSCSSGAPIA